MPLIDDHLFVLKHSKQPKGSTYVLKTESVKERFAALEIQDLRFELIFDNKQHIWKEGRDEPTDKGVMHICLFTFNPLCKYSFCSDWQEIGEFPKVQAELYAIPELSWRQGGFSKNEIHELIDKQIKFLIAESKRNSTWRIDVDFLFREKVISSKAVCRTNNDETQNSMTIGRSHTTHMRK